MAKRKRRVRPNTKKKLLEAIELLHEVSGEVENTEVFSASIVRAVAAGLSHLADHGWKELTIVLENGEGSRLGTLRPTGQALHLVESAEFTVWSPMTES